MLTKKKILKFLDIHRDETKDTLFMFFFSFSIGMIHNIMTSVPLAMFLAHYKSDYLPYIYIGAGLSMAMGGIAFFYLQKITSMFHVLTIPIGLFSFSLFAFWGILFVIKSPWIYIALIIWSIMLVFFSASIMMIFCNQIFTLQQSKRLFGLIFVGLATGGILIGLGMDFLLTFVGPKNLILLAALILLFGLSMQLCIKKYAKRRLRLFDSPEKGENRNVSLNSFSDKKYVLCVFALTVVLFSVFYGFDFLLNTVVQKHYQTEHEIGVFFGLLLAAYDFANIALGLFFFPWILTRFGLNITLMLWPATLAVLLSLAFFTHLIPPLAGILFPLLIVTAVFQSSVNESITLQSVLLLFQPLKVEQRAWAQLTNETIVGPLATSTVGLILLLIDEYFGFRLSTLILLLVGLCLTAAAIIFFVLKKGYLKLLVESLTKSVITKPKISKIDKDSLVVMKDRIRSPYPDEIIYLIEAIENTNQNEFVKILAETLNSPFEEVRCFSLSKIEQYRIQSMENPVKQICEAKESPEILGAALLALGSIAGSTQLTHFKNYLFDENPEIVGSSLIAFLKYCSRTKKNEMIEILIQKAQSSREEERLMAAQVLTHVKIPNEIDLIVPLLKDPSLEVRIVASIAAHRISDEKVLSALIDNLAHSHTRDSALTSLVALGSGALQYILQNFPHFPPKIQVELIDFIGYMKDPKSSAFLEQLLPSSKGRVFYTTLQSLKKLSYKADEKSRIWMRKLLKSENNKIIPLKEIVVSLKSEKTKLLHDLLCREIELSQECCFSLLDFIYPEAAVTKAQHGLASGDHDLHSNAVELLLHTLEKKDQKLFLEQLIFSPYKADQGPELSIEKMEEFLKKITDSKTHYYISELSAAAIYTMGVLGLKNLLGFIQEHESREDPLMKENVAWTLNKLTN